MGELLHVMDGIVASGGQAGKLVALDIGHSLRIDRVQGALLKAARALMAMEAFAVIVRVVKLHGLLRPGDVLGINVVQSAELGFEAAENRVVRVAGVAGLIARYTPILKMCRWYIGGIIHIQALPVLAHDMAAQTERRLLCAVHVVLEPEQAGKNRKDKERQKRQYLSSPCNCQVRTQGHQAGENDRYQENREYQRRRHMPSNLQVILYLRLRMYLIKLLIWSSVSLPSNFGILPLPSLVILIKSASPSLATSGE